MKDRFSHQSKNYAAFRPSYPEELFRFLLQHVQDRQSAWDAGTGNGQIAVKLAEYFQTVHATDISGNQLKNAVQKENIFYKKEAAEHTSFPDKEFDLITIAQAIHWVRFEEFYAEVKRTGKQDAILAVTGYALPEINAEVDAVIRRLYTDILGAYWDPERKYVDELYHTIPFPFIEIESPPMETVYEWSAEHLLKYLGTWSAALQYRKINGRDPVEEIEPELYRVWPAGELRTVRFPLLLRAGRIHT